jgi:2-iminobutanoate/2-iminopropanoate deaminase
LRTSPRGERRAAARLERRSLERAARRDGDATWSRPFLASSSRGVAHAPRALIDGSDTHHVLEAIFKALGVRPGSGVSSPPAKGVSGNARTTSVTTEAAPAPFQGAPYSQAIKAGDFVFVSGQLGLKPGDTAISGSIKEQTEQVFRNLNAILEAAGSGLDRLVKTTVFLANLSDFQEMNGVYASHVGENKPARSTVEVARCLPARSSRSKRSRPSDLRPQVEDYVGSLGLDAYLVGGAVRDELLGLDVEDADFLVARRRPRRLARAARAARACRGPRGRGPAVGLRLCRATARCAGSRRRDRVRAAARERSTGPGRHDFEIVVDARHRSRTTSRGATSP